MLFWIVIYVVGAIGTAIFNLWLIAYVVVYPLAIVRNALLWPVCLPILLVIWLGEFN